MYGSTVPQGSAAPAGPPQSALDAYMANYGQRLQAMLSSEAGGGALGGNPVMYQDPTSSLGPDMYQGYRVGEGAPFARSAAAPPQNASQTQGSAPQQGQSAPSAPPQAPVMGRPPADVGPQSALAPNASPAARRAAFASGGGGAPQRSALAAGGGGAAPTSGAGASDQGVGASGQGGQKPYGFRDMWNGLSAKQRKQQTDELATQLKAGQQTINSAYATMMQQLGTRPQAGLSRQDKGMLLMEFGLRMMQHSASPAQGGYGKNFGAAAGAAGAETMQGAMALRQQHEQRAYDYDRLKQQMAMAQGRDLANLQSRSVLEAGRDFRAMNREDSLMERSAFQQGQQNQRQQSALQEREGEGAANRAAANARNQARINAPSKGRGAAAASNYQLYMDTFGKDANGQPLTGQALQKAKEQALNFASNPHGYRISDAQATQMALTSADKFISSQRDAFLSMSPQQVQAKRDQIAAETKERLLRGGTPGPVASALAPAGATPPAGTAPAAGAPKPTAMDLAYLKAHPEKAAAFQRRFGYLPQQ